MFKSITKDRIFVFIYRFGLAKYFKVRTRKLYFSDHNFQLRKSKRFSLIAYKTEKSGENLV